MSMVIVHHGMAMVHFLELLLHQSYWYQWILSTQDNHVLGMLWEVFRPNHNLHAIESSTKCLGKSQVSTEYKLHEVHKPLE